MFLTALEDFDYKPYYKDGELVRGKVVTQSTLVWSLEGLGKITVPSGFVTDLASLPWFTLFLFKRLGKHQRGAVLHDYLYRTKWFTKTYTDKQFNIAMKQDNVARWRRNLIMSGLAVGGWVAWAKNKSIEIAKV